MESSPAVKTIISALESWKIRSDIVTLSLDCPDITDDHMKSIIQIIVQCQSLANLNLSTSHISLTSVPDICQLIVSANVLSEINLSGTKLPLRAIPLIMVAVIKRSKCNLHDLKRIIFDGCHGIHSIDNNKNHKHEKPNKQMNEVRRRVERKSVHLSEGSDSIIYHLGIEVWTYLMETNFENIHEKLNDAEIKFILQRENYSNDTGISRTPINPKWEILSKDGQSIISQSLSIMKIGDITADLCVLPKPDEPGWSNSFDGDNDPRRKLTHTRLRSDLNATSTSVSLSQDSPLRRGAEVECDNKKKTFKLKELLNEKGTIDSKKLDKLVEYISIDASDEKTGYTLLEYACRTHNLGLAKWCYRRNATLDLVTQSGDTPFTIATSRKDYTMMECLHTYSVGVNSKDREGRTALHVATANNDVDGICRLIEWGANVNQTDNMSRTALHYASIGGHMKVCMLLLELGADLHAEDQREYTTVAHAEANDHFELMDRLISLGGRGHRLHRDGGKISSQLNSNNSNNSNNLNNLNNSNNEEKEKSTAPYISTVQKTVNKYAKISMMDDLLEKQKQREAKKELRG